MRMAELARTSGCTIATIKFYLREGLLPAGEITGATQADYGESHVERLRLIRVLREVGDIPVSRIGEVLAAIDDTDRPLAEVLSTAHHALGPEPTDESDDHVAARREMVAFVARLGWNVDPAAPSFDVLATALLALRQLGRECGPDTFGPYAADMFALAEVELATIDPSQGPADTVTQIIVGTIVNEEAMVALRRLAEEHHSNVRFGISGPAPRSGRRRRPTT
jgi:DNA-binding transcriptional MerR regulator